MEDLLHRISTMAGIGSSLFLASMCIGAGLHCGLRFAARWFGAIRVTQITHTYHHSSDGGLADG